MKVLTEEMLRQIQSEVDKEVSKIPAAHCRKRYKAMAAMMINMITTLDEVAEEEAKEGEKIVYTYTCNLGTKKYPDVYRDYSAATVERETEKSYMIGYRVWIRKENVLAVVRG